MMFVTSAPNCRVTPLSVTVLVVPPVNEKESSPDVPSTVTVLPFCVKPSVALFATAAEATSAEAVAVMAATPLACSTEPCKLRNETLVESRPGE